MLTETQTKRRINQLITKDNNTDNQSNRYYAECMAYISAHLVAFYKQYANQNGLSLNQTATLVNHWDMQQWKQAINSMDMDDWPNEATARVRAYGNAAGIDRTHMMSNIAKVGLIAFAVKELKMMNKRIKQDGIDQVDFLKRHMNVPEQTSRQAYSFVTDPKRQEIWSKNLWSDTDQLANDVETLVNHHLRHGMKLHQLESILETHANPKQFKPNQSIAARVHQMEFNARRIVRTESANFVNHVNIATYRQVGVTLVKVVPQPDPCSEHCAPVIADNPYNISDPPDVPIHPNCRCTLCPVGTKYERFVTMVKPT